MKFTNLTGTPITIVDNKSKHMKTHQIKASDKFIIIEDGEYVPVTRIDSLPISRLKNYNEVTLSVVHDDGKIDINILPSQLNSIFPKIEDHFYIVRYECIRFFVNRNDVLFPSEPYRYLNTSRGKLELSDGKYLSLCQNPFC